MTDFFGTLRSIPGTAAKVAYAKEHHNAAIDQIVADAMDPSITYGVTSKDVKVLGTTDDPQYLTAEGYAGFRNILNALAKRELTGNRAVDAVSEYVSKFTAVGREMLLQVLDRDLKMGISWKTWRAEVLGISEKFEVALAQHLEKVKGVNPVNGTYYASRKCDGVRCVAIVDLDEGTVEFRSRQNKEFTTLENLKPGVSRFCAPLSGKWVLDGELCKVDANGDEDFQSMMKEIRRKDYMIEDCCYQVFDILTYDEFCEGKSKEILSVRFKRLAELAMEYAALPHDRCYVKPLKQELLHSQDDFDRWSGYVSEGNWEGFMLRKNTYYQSGRTKDLLKVKKFFDAEYTVEGVECGSMTTALPGQGNVTFEGVTRLLITHKGTRVGVGAGLSREQRIAWMNDPKLIVGKVITVKYFEETTNADGNTSLRFPTLKVVHGAERDT